MKINIEKVKFGPPVDPLCPPPHFFIIGPILLKFSQYVKSKKKLFVRKNVSI